jgi:hypothetical protein
MAGKKNRSGILAGAGLAAMAVAASGGQTKAATLFSTGFEPGATGSFTSYGYAPNANLTQQPATPPASTVQFASLLSPDLVASTIGSQGTATVYTYASSNIIPSAGNTQYVGVSDLNGINPLSAAFYYPNLPSISPVTAGTPIVNVFATIGVLQGLNNAAFGLTALDGTASPNQNVVADVQINATTGAVTADEGSVATTFTQPIATGVTFDDYELQLNYATGQYQVLEGSSASSLTPITPLLAFETPGATTFSTGAIDTESFATTGSATGYALVDNLSISASVPEPASASLILGGLVVAGGRRRRRSTVR